MGDSPIRIASGFERDVSSFVRTGVSPDSNPSTLGHYHTCHKVISLILIWKGHRRTPLMKKFLHGFFDALLLDDDIKEDHTVVHMPPPILSVAKM